MQAKNVRSRRTIKQWFMKNWRTFPALAVILALFIGLGLWARDPGEAGERSGDYSEYETGKILKVLSDTTEPFPDSDNAYRGEQLLLVQVTSGQYAGKQLQVYNYVSPTYNVPLSQRDGVTVLISTYSDGTIRATVFEYDREWAIFLILGLFLLVTVLVGGKTGAKSLLGLAVTIAALFYLLIPLLFKGLPVIPTVFGVCALVSVACFVILGGVHKKTCCAMLGTVLGMALAMAFGLFAQTICKIDGLRFTDVEPLLQLRQQGTPIGLKGLLVGGVIISTLGAVMDVAMSLSSALWEVHCVDPTLGRGALFRSGMNVGRDMVGTMTNTLILALLGGSFVLILYLYSMGLSYHQLMSSSYLALEVISAIASSIGVVLSVPITAAVASVLYGKK